MNETRIYGNKLIKRKNSSLSWALLDELQEWMAFDTEEEDARKMCLEV